MHHGGRKFKLFSAGSGFTSQIFSPGNYLGWTQIGYRDSVYLEYAMVLLLFVTIFFFNKSKPKESDKPKVNPF